MLETSGDLLRIVFAVSLAWLTLFISWAIFYVVMILRDVSLLSASVRRKIELVDDILKIAKDKLESTSVSMGLLVDGVSKIVKFFQARQAKKAKRKAKD